jgi:hypothetical protein
MGHERALYGSLYPKYFDGLKIEVVEYDRNKKWTGPEADITIFELPSPLQLDEDKLIGYIEQWNYFLDRYVTAFTSKDVRTVGVDTMTLMRKVKINAYLQELQGAGKARKQLTQIEYGHPDGEIRDLFVFAKTSGKNLVATHHLREHYAPGMSRDGAITTVPDGTYEIDGVRDTAKYADVIVRMEKEKDGKIWGKLTTCGVNLSYEGQSIPNMSWDSLVNMIEVGWYGRPFERRKMEVGSDAK